MLKEMLMTILETIRGQPERDFFEIDIPFKPSRDNNQPLIITQMSYRTIEQRIMTKHYASTEGFIHDMKQLEHNWTLVDKDKIKTLKAIIKYIIGDINEMESCIHCYASAFVVSNWFSAACKRPHLLIWAKLKGVSWFSLNIPGCLLSSLIFKKTNIYSSEDFFSNFFDDLSPLGFYCLLSKITEFLPLLSPKLKKKTKIIRGKTLVSFFKISISVH